MDEREKLLGKLERYLAIRDRISDELTVAVIEELIKETEERITQIEKNVPDEKALQLPSGEVPQ
jgi:hypothetical protein